MALVHVSMDRQQAARLTEVLQQRKEEESLTIERQADAWIVGLHFGEEQRHRYWRITPSGTLVELSETPE